MELTHFMSKKGTSKSVINDMIWIFLNLILLVSLFNRLSAKRIITDIT